MQSSTADEMPPLEPHIAVCHHLMSDNDELRVAPVKVSQLRPK